MSQRSGTVDILAAQRNRVRGTTTWATWARDALGALAQEYLGHVHFRPSSTGVSVVGLSPDGPQLGKRAYRDLTRTRLTIEETLKLRPGRCTPEKRLQSFLIASAYLNERSLQPLCAAAARIGRSADLVFVTDELFLPMACSPKRGRGCDLLGFRRVAPDAIIPVQVELKSDDNSRAELFRELDRYAPLIDLHAKLFEELFGAVLGQAVHFSSPAEKWAICPPASRNPDRQLGAFADRDVRLITYKEPTHGQFEFQLER